MKKEKIYATLSVIFIGYLGLVGKIYIWHYEHGRVVHGVLDFNVFKYEEFWVVVGAGIVFFGLTYLMKIWDRIFKK